MSEEETQTGVEEIVFQLGNLTISVGSTTSSPPVSVAPASSVSAGDSPQRVPLAGPLRPQVVSSLPRSSASTTAVLGTSPPEPWTSAWRVQLLQASTPAALCEVDFAPVDHLAAALRSASSEWTPRARVTRALRAGVSARQRLDLEVGAVVPSPSVGLGNNYYVVLRAAPSHSAGWTCSYRAYRLRVRGVGLDLFHPDSVSHAFPSRAEVEAYLIGAGEAWPPRYEGET